MTLGVPHVRLQELCTVVLEAREDDDLLTALVDRVHGDLRASRTVLILPAGDRWGVEIAVGDRAGLLLGETVREPTRLGRALSAHDAEAVESVTPPDQVTLAGTRAQVLTRAVDIGEQGMGALILVRDLPIAFTAVDRERGEGIAALLGLALVGAHAGGSEELDDERGRIARDLHDLAIQELFGVGMELESLQRALADSAGAVGVSPGLVRSVETSVGGLERAVAQIRQIVQSLRRERPSATLSEQLRHEAGLAIAGLGFAPTLRLPSDVQGFDSEVPEEIAEDVVAVVREALANAARHAHATAVAVAVSVVSEGVDRVVQVDVSDNGRGIDPSVTRRSGLANMSSRARRHRGWVDAIPLDRGTMISWRATLPAR
ncbi:sensor histidine kinase [Brachybacterium sp. AOP25-B2-12]|uniref:sensor histidine kinase n=1 Tax=Brachybacterium sp. AOP25-B2-12 TaxID=3457710 RepID=UPI004034C88F